MTNMFINSFVYFSKNQKVLSVYAFCATDIFALTLD